MNNLNYSTQVIIGWVLLAVGALLIVSCMPFSVWSLVAGILLAAIGIFILATHC